MAKIELWLEYASTYSYLTVARIGKLADAKGLAIDWQPFWLYPVREEQRLPMPFPEGSARARYMWTDLERRARELGLPYRRPEVYPFNSMPIGRVALLAAREGWCRPFTEEAFRLHWTQGVLMGTAENLAAALAFAKQDPQRVQALAASVEIKDAFKQQTERALERGIFGSPSFVVDGELFWGDDRLEAAIERALRAA
ncbi:2-hydroxychromene-2-carboxylate isomerase [Ramlibacter sp. XY19]|uniref:2-hydroxychromene-2-carboxylate isomerase n=1 Tax=Ramlibacter paludis TaxID=2908000 RepID=UPI0023DAD117|nr:2-hydroxychromene-2-carboxylate isomerase [Ramlibacter paludis]MCG2593100.1 2-hydroxychromene-2-carboxylate isomerase [Ramlibacter paludis]